MADESAPNTAPIKKISTSYSRCVTMLRNVHPEGATTQSSARTPQALDPGQHVLPLAVELRDQCFVQGGQSPIHRVDVHG